MEFDVIIAACFFLLFAAFGKLIYHNLINPITVFCGVWGVILLLYSLHAYDLYYASEGSSRLIIVGVVMFFIGAVIATLAYSKNRNIDYHLTSLDAEVSEMNYLALLGLNLISFFFLFGFGVTVIQQLLSGRGFDYIHRMYLDEEGVLGGESTFNRSIIAWFVWPLMDASLVSIVLSVHGDAGNKSMLKKWCLILVFANLALFTIITGKRAHLVYLIIYFFAVFKLQGKTVKLKAGTKFLMAVGLIAIILVFNYITFSRGSTSVLRTLYFYFVGCVPLMSEKLSASIDPKGLTSIYGFFAPLISLANAVLHSSTLSAIKSSMTDVVILTQIKEPVSRDSSMNAFVSLFYYFYLDGGVLGNIVMSLIYGSGATVAYHRYLKKRDYLSLAVYLLVFFSMYMSFVRFQFFQMRFALAFFYVAIIFHSYKTRFAFGKKKQQIK